MSDPLVSVRLPQTLLDRLKRATEQDDFMDLSELMRHVVREHWLRSQDPSSYEIAKLRKEIKDQLSKKVTKLTQKGIVDELEHMKRVIRDE